MTKNNDREFQASDFGDPQPELTAGDQKAVNRWLEKVRRADGAQPAADASNNSPDDVNEITVDEVDLHAARRPSKLHRNWGGGHARGGRHRGSGKKGPGAA